LGQAVVIENRGGANGTSAPKCSRSCARRIHDRNDSGGAGDQSQSV
jgi:hypothetical protein